jgi:pSer/pThr/pTyr-binding forkhead associated (FHA) protein
MAPEVRPGGTMLHVPRVTPRERLHGPRREGRTPHSEEWYVLLERALDVGRDATSDVVIKDHTVSMRHATVRPVPGTDRATVEDHDSRNGTAHNGRRIEAGQPAQLITGDELCFGRQVFVFLSASDWHGYLTGAL